MPANKILKEISSSKIAARKMAATITLKELDKAISNLTSARDTIEKQALENEAKQYAAKIRKVSQLMKKMGLSHSDLAELSQPPSRRRQPSARKAVKTKVAPKYRITVNGKKTEWTGRGKTPVVFRQFVDGGGDLSKCLIK